MIRPATRADIIEIVGMVKRLREHAGYPLPFDPPFFSQSVAASIDAEDHLCLVVDMDGVKGVLLAALQSSMFFRGRVAHEYVLWIEPSARGHWFRPLLRHYEGWARDSAAVAVFLSSLHDGRTSAVFSHVGFDAVQAHHLKVF